MEKTPPKGLLPSENPQGSPRHESALTCFELTMRGLMSAATRFTAAVKCLVAAWYLPAAQYPAPASQVEFGAEPGSGSRE
jgi:hypothetical protein